MAGFGNFDISELKNLQKQLNKLAVSDTHEFMESCVKELAMRLLRSVKRMTPVDTGSLRRGWNANGNEGDGESLTVDVSVEGGVYTVTITNREDYDVYVEYGHRTRSGGWVPGRFMMTISEEELRSMAPQVLEQKLDRFLKGAFG